MSRGRQGEGRARCAAGGAAGSEVQGRCQAMRPSLALEAVLQGQEGFLSPALLLRLLLGYLGTFFFFFMCYKSGRHEVGT